MNHFKKKHVETIYKIHGNTFKRCPTFYLINSTMKGESASTGIFDVSGVEPKPRHIDLLTLLCSGGLHRQRGWAEDERNWSEKIPFAKVT